MDLTEVTEDHMIAGEEVGALQEVTQVRVTTCATSLVRLGFIQKGGLMDNHARRGPLRIIIERLWQCISGE